MSQRPAPASAKHPPSTEWVEQTLDAGLPTELAVRIYGQGRRAAGSAALVLHFHGGAFVSGSPESGSTVARLLAAAGATVVSVAYPLAPAHPFPAAPEAGYAALLWSHRGRSRLAGPRARLFVAGEEAGGNLAAALALMARDRQTPPIAGQILLSPMLDPCLGTASLRHSADGGAGCPWADGWCQYLRQPQAAEHPYAAPGRARRLAGLPPALLLSAQDDPLRDETRAYGRRLAEAGVAVETAVLPAPSGWPTALLTSAESRPAWADGLLSRFEAFLARPGLTPITTTSN
jgi:acetyl esterase/lipase